MRCDVEAASQSISPMQGGAHSLSSCGDEGGLAGLKLMAIKTPLAPHPIHYEQHCRRRRSSLVLPVTSLPWPWPWIAGGCLGDTKLAAVARMPKARRHRGRACPSTPGPPSSISCPKLPDLAPH